METSFKILLIGNEGPLTDQVISVLREYPKFEMTTPAEVSLEIDRIAPDIVLLIHPEDGSELELIQYIQSESTAQVIIFIADQQNFQLLRDVTRSGADDFFVLPDEVYQFQDRLQKISDVIEQKMLSDSEVAAGQALRRGRGQVYAFFSGKGGVGRTLLSTTFSQTLQFESTSQVILIDMNLQYGGVETFLGIESRRSLVDLKPVIEELNENHIRNVSEKEEHSKLEILLSPKDAEAAERVTDTDVTRLIRACRRSYDFVILDLPTEMNANTYAALEESDLIYYIMNLDTPSISVFKQTEELFQRLGMDTDGRLELVINQKDRSTELKPNDLKEFIAAPIVAELRRDIKGVQPAVNKGEPLRKQTRERKIVPFAKDVRKWVNTMLK